MTTEPTSAETLEIEVKFYIPDVPSMRSSLIELGAKSRGRSFETNMRYDTPGRDLFQRKVLLRLRQDTKTTLTLKTPPESRPDLHEDQFKIFRELEVEISDLSQMEMILKELGFNKTQVYKKWRESFLMEETVFCVDELPYGSFLEIEGREGDILSLSETLGLEWKKRILLNYLKMFELIKDKLKLTFSDVTFSNFENVQLDISEYLHLFEAGKQI